MSRTYPLRIRRLCSLLFRAETFADIGCDHGYCAEYMLANGLCARATVTDIRPACLSKAERLLAPYVASGACVPLCTDGLRGVDRDTELVLIAGMGGMEIAQILREGFIPRNFVLQPMRDTREVRSLLLAGGAHISGDFMFSDGKNFYDVLTGSAAGGTDAYSADELSFGRDNVRSRGRDFLAWLDREIGKTDTYLSQPLGPDARAELERRKEYLERVRDGENARTL